MGLKCKDAGFTGSPQFGWHLWRAAANEDGDADYAVSDEIDYEALVVSEIAGKATDGLLDTVRVFGDVCKNLEARFFSWHASAQAADDKTFGVEIIGLKLAGPGMHVCVSADNAIVFGKNVFTRHPTLRTAGAGRWVDTIAVTDCWPGIAVVDSTGADRIASISWPTNGYRYFHLRVFKADGTTGTEAKLVGAIITAL